MEWACRAQIEEDRNAVIPYHDVLGLEIEVKEPAAVQIVHGVEHACEQPDPAFERLRERRLPQIGPVDPPGRQTRDRPSVEAGQPDETIRQRDQPRMFEIGEQAPFELECARRLRTRSGQLQHDGEAGDAVLREAHPALRRHVVRA
jgi:hypothetical protein